MKAVSNNSYLSLGHGKKNDHYKMGRLTATLTINGVYNKGKSISLFAVSPEIAYDTIDFWAETMAQELNLPYKKTSFAALMAKVNGEPLTEQQELANNDLKKVMPPSLTATPLGKLMRNTRYLQMALVPVYEAVGLKRIKVLFAESIAMLEELEVEKEAEAAIKVDASKIVAAAFFEIYADKGIDMSSTINDAEILKQFRILKTEHEAKK